MYYYALTKDPGRRTVFSYSNQWDSIFGCNCDSNYHGVDWSLRYCPNGDVPLTGKYQISPANSKSITSEWNTKN